MALGRKDTQTLIHYTLRLSPRDLQRARELAEAFGVPVSVAFRAAFVAGTEQIEAELERKRISEKTRR